ncbi:MAG TPA: hypothetical protein PLO33_20135 [Kouleothrix sp.]|uniref:hypothetical protein n=1 Tax=Kouleothrix sp. TaxID=2779161 RepID=UPI002C047315|nr:hypothetical protein [Kouleothrix sp.]HRC78006.1 hypothetical protein [Kouleothrix sp.]
MSNDPEKQGGSFVVRIWWEHSSDEQGGGRWRGWVQHVRNGNQIYFASLHDLNSFIAGEIGIERGEERASDGLG